MSWLLARWYRGARFDCWPGTKIGNEKAPAGTAKNGEEVVDEAFINLAMADAFRIMGERGGYDKTLARAEELAADFNDAGLQSWFKEERAKAE